MHKAAMEMGKWALEWAKATGYDNITAQGWDNLKDCMEAVKEAICADKEYREIEEMDEYGDMEKFEKMLSMGNDRMGYDRWRYANGRFAPKGRGTRRGYTPYLYMMEDMYEDEPFMPELENYRMGYPMGRDGMRSDGMKDGRYGRYDDNRTGRNEGSKYGKSYDRYDDARRHYHDTKDMDSMRKMEESFGVCLDDFGEIADDTWKDLTPEQKNKQKPKINQMIQKLQKLQQM